jgi:tetratricopeptide (TPR) repeat protein
MSSIKERGDKTTQLGLQATGEYYYSFAGASTSALRYAVEYILWLKGEGDTLANFTSDSRYSGWDTIAEINYASPFTSYFEGLLLEIQGQYEESLKPYSIASIMPSFPDEGLDFYYLKKMEVADLYALRDRLRDLEEKIYTAYTPNLTGREWDRYLYHTDYLLGLSAESVDAKDYAKALTYARLALKADPFSADVWNNAAACALLAQDLPLTGSYVDEGLAIFPEDERLLELRRSFLRAGEEMEGEP